MQKYFDERRRGRRLRKSMRKWELSSWTHAPGVSSIERTERAHAARLIRSAMNRGIGLRGRGNREKVQLRTLTVQGDLDLDHLAALSSLPSLQDGLHVSGSLGLQGCSGLASLPDGLHVGGHLNVNGCTLLSSLPAGLHVGGYFCLLDCTGIKSLEGGVCVGGYLSLCGCTAITNLPSGLHVGGSIFLNDCIALASLPDGLEVGGSLNLSGCTSLTSLPGGLMRVAADLYLRGCCGLTSLPGGIQVGGDMDLRDCTSLTSLGDAGLHVEGDLDLWGCIGLTSLPDGLHVGGRLSIRGCTGLTSLPNSVLEWGLGGDGRPHDINLERSGLPPAELARLQALGNPALRFHVTMDESFGGEGRCVGDFTTLNDATAFWVAQAGLSGADSTISPYVEAAYEHGVLHFLSKLRRAEEFNNSTSKAGLAKRVVEVLQLLSGHDEGVRKEVQVRMADAVDTCSDKPMWALNQMGVLVEVCEARGDRQKLKDLGLRVMRLEVVHRHVRKAMEAMTFIDDVCVYLRFEIALRESLGLPVSATGMKFPRYITVTEEMIAEAEAEALELTDEDLEAWLENWSEWQRQDRVDFAEGFELATLKRSSTKRLSLNLRSLVGSKVTDPVRVQPLKTIWSLQDLLRHWVNTGMDLNNTPRSVAYMRLNLKGT